MYKLLLQTLFMGSMWANAQDSTLTLPFEISNLKKLDSLELSSKREGTFITGIPDISIDPLNGFGYGIEGSITFNGKRDNPFFSYTPYLTQIDIALFNTSKNQRELTIAIDKPYIFKSKWRLRGELGYEINPNLVYFGINDFSLNHLNVISENDKIPLPVFNGTNYKDYQSSLTDQYRNFNNYIKQEFIVNLSGEYALFDSKMRILIGGEFAKLNITTLNDSVSRVQKDKELNHLLGVGPSKISFLQFGVVYDTRDFEPDPNRGVFAEITNEFSNQIIGSDFNMNKLFAQVKWFKQLFPKKLKKTIFATRFGIGYTFGNAPFFEYQDEWSSEGSIEGLGGANTLRGFKQSRFLDRGMFFYNTEIRSRFAKITILKQDLTFSAVPFFDLGSVFHYKSQNFNFNQLKYSEGIGLRIAWNLSTILRFDFAISDEDQQFFFTFNHSF